MSSSAIRCIHTRHSNLKKHKELYFRAITSINTVEFHRNEPSPPLMQMQATPTPVNNDITTISHPTIVPERSTLSSSYIALLCSTSFSDLCRHHRSF
ncbi:hypothetical protein NPIL_195861 [Nephila pilipes]|uniref:Uncharacterized protein n=1 Tax=Nephila pilipes TaxID=299642 RepID=A0A8X6NHQ9_NEPPI|nr:hypothetical protein NPIL_195861 [Nephila pilipes]